MFQESKKPYPTAGKTPVSSTQQTTAEKLCTLLSTIIPDPLFENIAPKQIFFVNADGNIAAKGNGILAGVIRNYLYENGIPYKKELLDRDTDVITFNVTQINDIFTHFSAYKPADYPTLAKKLEKKCLRTAREKTAALQRLILNDDVKQLTKSIKDGSAMRTKIITPLSLMKLTEIIDHYNFLNGVLPILPQELNEKLAALLQEVTPKEIEDLVFVVGFEEPFTTISLQVEFFILFLKAALEENTGLTFSSSPADEIESCLKLSFQDVIALINNLSAKTPRGKTDLSETIANNLMKVIDTIFNTAIDTVNDLHITGKHCKTLQIQILKSQFDYSTKKSLKEINSILQRVTHYVEEAENFAYNKTVNTPQGLVQRVPDEKSIFQSGLRRLSQLAMSAGSPLHRPTPPPLPPKTKADERAVSTPRLRGESDAPAAGNQPAKQPNLRRP